MPQNAPYFIDSHCHLHNQEFFPGSAAKYIARAEEANVRKLVVIGTSYADSMLAQSFAAEHKNVYWTFGVHPSEFEKPYQEPDFAAPVATPCPPLDFASASRPPLDSASAPCLPPVPTRPIAIGEVGLDYHYGPADYGGLPLSSAEIKKRQWRLLEQMLELGIRHHLPFSFHVREAFDDFFAILHNFPEVCGVVHSFTGNKKNLRKCLEHNLYIGVNGLVTYSTLPQPPLERILLETDAPFLAPVPHRGKNNEPAYIPLIAAWLAAAQCHTLAEVAQITTANFHDLFLGHSAPNVCDPSA